MMEGVNLTNLHLSTYGNVIMNPPVKLIYANKMFLKRVKGVKCMGSNPDCAC
jgi:hypothetical protein